MAAVPPPGGFLGGLGRIGGILAPDVNSADYDRQVQLNALVQLGLGTLAGAGQPGASFGGALAGGLQQAQQSLQGAQQQAFQSRQEKRREEREDRLEEQQNARVKLDNEAAAIKSREKAASVASRVATGIGNAKGRELEYLKLVGGTPELQSVFSQYGIDPTSITTPEQVTALGQQLSALGSVGVEQDPARSEPLEAIEGPDGKPLLVPRSQAINKTPFSKPSGGVNVNVNNNPSGEERKGATLAVRLEGALQGLQSIQQVDPSALSPTLPEKAVGSVSEIGANALRSPMRQQAAAAQLDALDAALTLSTGAAYTKEQLEGLRNSYFPQIGDDPKTVAAKQQRFESLVNSAYIAAGRAAPQVGEALKPRTAGAPPKLTQNADGSYTYSP